ncbi:MAG: recombinase family protein [Clostridiaceae bacterium]|nr:recombinase family protein [Clostridiaceae bacterium]
MMETIYTAGLYCRLSKEDKIYGESMSIDTQRKKLADYATTNNITVCDVYIDDGLSGVTFSRPSFERMMADVDCGKLNCVIVKDLSRLGRDDSKANYYYEDVFIRDDIRFIAIDDNVDTLRGYENIVPFMNMFNAMYPRDISKKTRSAFRTKAQHGEFLGSKAPFGYYKDPNDKHKLIVDEEAATVVREIFELAIQGHGYNKIARILRDRKILNPSAYTNQTMPCHYKSEYWRDSPHDWHVTSLKVILENEVYLGHMVQSKRRKVSHKSDKIVKNPKEQWIKVENTHEPIISQEVWDLAHKVLSARKRDNNAGTSQMFAGLLKCADCGNAITYTCKKNYGSFSCSLYRVKGKDYCTIHYISYNDLYNIVFSEIQRHIKTLKKSETKLYNAALSFNKSKKNRETKAFMEQLSKYNKRISDLDVIIKRLYEDSVLSNISSDRFYALSKDYEAEQLQLKSQVDDINAKLAEYDKAESDARSFVELIRKYIDIKELNAKILNELIDKIVIGNKYIDENGEKVQDITIYYKFCGNIEY